MRKFSKIAISLTLAAMLALSPVILFAGGAVAQLAPDVEAIREYFIEKWTDYIENAPTPVAVVLDGQMLRFNVPAIVVGGTTLVPRAGIFDALGVSPIPSGEVVPITVIGSQRYVSLRDAARYAGVTLTRGNRTTVYLGRVPTYATFTDQLGAEHSVRPNPTRIAIYDDGILDVMMNIGFGNLGIEKIGVTFDPANPPIWWDYEGDIEIVNIGTLFILDWAALDALQPDLIITQPRSFAMNPDGDRHGNPGTELYRDATMKRFPVPFARLAWSTPSNLVGNLEINSAALQALFPAMAAEIAETVDDMIAQIDEIAAQTGEYRALFIDMVNPNNFTPQFENGRFDQIYCAFGFTAAAPLNSLAGVENNIYARAAWVAEVNPDVIFLFNRGGQTGNAESLERFLGLEGIQATTAYQNGHIIYNLPNIEWYTAVNGFTSINRMIYDVTRFLDAR